LLLHTSMIIQIILPLQNKNNALFSQLNHFQKVTPGATEVISA
ncbi:17031_t:CDS:1, partial [Racocetra persica]